MALTFRGGGRWTAVLEKLIVIDAIATGSSPPPVIEVKKRLS
jgi:hypothetical protein